MFTSPIFIGNSLFIDVAFILICVNYGYQILSNPACGSEVASTCRVSLRNEWLYLENQSEIYTDFLILWKDCFTNLAGKDNVKTFHSCVCSFVCLVFGWFDIGGKINTPEMLKLVCLKAQDTVI